MKVMYFDCPNCGHIGRLEELQQHWARPMPEDIGFCPRDSAEITELFTAEEMRPIIADYDEDPDQVFAEIDARLQSLAE